LTKNGSVVLFLAKLNSFPDINPIIGNLLYRMWKPFEGRFSLITTITEDNNTNLNNWGELREVLGQNVIMIPKLDSKDMLHSVRHWGEILNYKFNTEEEKLIVKLSQGSPYISKLLCQSLISKPKSEEAGAFLKRVIKERLPWIERGTLRIETTTKSIWLDDSNVSLVFTPQEQLVLMCLQEKQGEVISRDKIAEILWGDQQYEKYSDWAIDKLVSILRFKINGLNCKSEIQTVKGKGYMYLGG
jgi:DNA-binding response OmpR family regulator